MTDEQKFLTDWTETDPANRLIQTDPRSTWTGLTRGDGLTYLTEDFGAAFFTLNRLIFFTFEITDLDSADATNNVLGSLIGISNNAASPLLDPHIRIDIIENGADDTTFKLTLDISEVGGATDSDTTVNLDVGTTYYCVLGRGDDGRRVWLSVYSDSGYAVKVADAVTYVASFDDTLRYMFAPWKANYGTDVNDYTDGYVENLLIWAQFYGGYYIQDPTFDSRQIAIVGFGDGMRGMGGIPRVCVDGIGTVRDIWLVETTSLWASIQRIRTTTGTKSYATPPIIEKEVILSPASVHYQQINSENEIVLSPVGVHYQQVNTEQEKILSPSASHTQQVNTENEVVLSPSSSFSAQVNAEQEIIL